MEALLAISGITVAGLAIATAVLAIRNGALKVEVADADTKRKAAEAALKVNTTKFDDYRRRAEVTRAELIEELEHFQKEKLDGIEETPDRSERIRKRRSWIGSVLSKASNLAGDDGGDGMREEGSA